jgi:hypothetical protein
MTEKQVNYAVAKQQDVIERVVIEGDLSALQPAERVQYYQAVCKSVGLNPLTKPFDYIKLNGKLVLYARKDATDQLRRLHQVSITRLEREHLEGVYVVTAYARDATGREDSATGAVNVDGLRGDVLANAFMKAETKAKRRVTLSICGLGWLDETELATVPSGERVIVTETGEIIDKPNGKKFFRADFITRIRELEAELDDLGHPIHNDETALDEASIEELKRIGKALADSIATIKAEQAQQAELELTEAA